MLNSKLGVTPALIMYPVHKYFVHFPVNNLYPIELKSAFNCKILIKQSEATV